MLLNRVVVLVDSIRAILPVSLKLLVALILLVVVVVTRGTIIAIALNWSLKGRIRGLFQRSRELG